jgi:hypothetical protein
MNAFTKVTIEAIIADATGGILVSDATTVTAGTDKAMGWQTEAQRLALSVRRRACGSR